MKASYDIIIIGGGIAGIGAAIKAGKEGASVLLVEHYGFLGGMSTAGMVSPFMKYAVNGTPLVRGSFEDIEKAMRAQNGMIDTGFYAWAFRNAAASLTAKYGVDVSYDTDLIEVKKDGEHITYVVLATAHQVVEVQGKIFIDASGDAQMIDLAHCPWLKGDEKTGKTQALTLFFRMGGIDVRKTCQYASEHRKHFLDWMEYDFDYSKILSIAGYKNFIKDAQARGEISKDFEYIFFTTLPKDGEGAFNTTNIRGLDPTNTAEITEAEKEGHQQVHQIVALAQKEIPGFENAYLIDTAVQVGVRETRRAVCEYMITGSDIRKGRKFPDVIARSCYGVDIHGQHGEDSVLEDVPEGDWYDVPLGSILVQKADNLMAIGRCMGSDRAGHSAIRVMPTACATGEAAGALGALAVKQGKTIREVQYKDLAQAISYNVK
ncbi:MAG: FAD-dependent oxidoreductase [Flavobacteriales bacterium]|nr:FAD-dependent oxidoreductase [Flavobacteriales bacterium]